MGSDDPIRASGGPAALKGDSSSPGGSSDNAAPKRLTGPERDLILRAIQQATPREGSVNFAGDLPPDGTFPGYELLREIHRGGQGVVYQAIQKTTRRKVAIKVLHGGPFSGSTGRSRFDREVQILGQLNHPNIVRLHDSGATADGGFFYVMDYISGRSLDEILAERPLGVDEALALFLKICDAVNAAHLKGVIHRDLKPSNVRIDANGDPVVVDFGLAKVALADIVQGDDGHTPQLMTMTGQFIGSLPWASPEQAEGLPGNIDVRTDVYSLGVMLYQMLTAQFPYRVAGNMRDILDNILRTEPARPSTVRRQINNEVETIVLKCLAKERERRYQSAGEVARDLRRYSAGEPIEAKRDSAVYVIRKTLSRYRAWATAGAVLAGMVIVFSIAMSVLYRSERSARRIADEATAKAQAAQTMESQQRARAEANFKAGHTLAMTMLGEVESSLSDLRGATAARATLLGQAQTYLDRLKTEVGDDPALLLDLATAHERVADLRGELYMGKLADSTGAAEHYAAARRIRDALVEKYPSDAKMQAALARSLYREGNQLGLRLEHAKAEQVLQNAVEMYDRAIRAAADPPATAWKRDRAWVLRALGRTQWRLSQQFAGEGDLVGARTALQRSEASRNASAGVWEAALAADAADVEAARALGVLSDERAGEQRLAAAAMSQTAAGYLSQGKREDAVDTWKAAIRRLGEAEVLSAAAVEEFERLSNDHPANGELRRDVMIALLAQGEAVSGRAALLPSLRDAGAALPMAPAEVRTLALSVMRKAEQIARGLCSADTASVQSQRDLAQCLQSMSRELQELGRFQEAATALREAVRWRDAIAKADGIELYRFELAAAQVRAAQCLALWSEEQDGAEAEASRDEARALARQAQQSLAVLVEQGAVATDAPRVREAGALLEALGNRADPS